MAIAFRTRDPGAVVRCVSKRCGEQFLLNENINQHLLDSHAGLKGLLKRIKVTRKQNKDILIQPMNPTENHECQICGIQLKGQRSESKSGHYWLHFQNRDRDLRWKVLAKKIQFNKETLQCPWRRCKGSYPNLERLEVHLALKHGGLDYLLRGEEIRNEPSEPSPEDDWETFRCSFCKRSFKSHFLLDQHLHKEFATLN